MSMGAQGSGYLSVEKAAQRNFFARGFAVSVDDDVECFATHFRDCCFDSAKRVVQNRLHERAPLDVDDADFPIGRFKNDRSVTWCALGIIQWAQQTGFGIDERKDLFLVPDMVAACDN